MQIESQIKKPYGEKTKQNKAYMWEKVLHLYIIFM